MTRPLFLDNTSAHTRAQRTAHTSTDYACAVDIHSDSNWGTAITIIGVVICVGLATLIYTGVLK